MCGAIEIDCAILPHVFKIEQLRYICRPISSVVEFQRCGATAKLQSLRLFLLDFSVRAKPLVVRSVATLIAIVRFIRQSAAANIKYLLSHTIHAAEFRHYVHLPFPFWSLGRTSLRSRTRVNDKLL